MFHDGCRRFHYKNDAISNDVILPDGHDDLPTGGLFHSTDNPFHRVLHIMILQGSYDLEAELERWQIDQFSTFMVSSWGSGWPGALSN